MKTCLPEWAGLKGFAAKKKSGMTLFFMLSLVTSQK